MDNMENAANLQNDSRGSQEEASSSFDLDSMDPEQRQKVEEELRAELSKVGQQTQTNISLPWFKIDSRSL